jgi:hypothetical protein
MSTRTGKIARLPRQIRDQLNRRLQNGAPAKRLVAWLNSLPEVRAVLKAEFGSRSVSEQNLSEWKLGGYPDWQLQQEAIELVRHMDADSNELNQASKLRLTDLLAQRLAARYAVATKLLTQSDTGGEIDLKLLRELCGDIVALRKGDHSAERLEVERERLEFEREQLRELREEEFSEWARDHRDEVCRGYKTPEERIARVRRIIFGGEAETATSAEPGLPGQEPLAPAAESNQIKPDQTEPPPGARSA